MGDLLIAAVAKEQNATVVTQNTDDFDRFDGVSAETYH
jgi:predicted nucleic acid-binding protein